MKKRLKSLGVPSLVLLALAAVLLCGGVAGSARAALNYYSDVYKSEIDLPSIGVQLYENGVQVGNRTYTGDGARSQATAKDYNDAENIGWNTATDGADGLLQKLINVTDSGEKEVSLSEFDPGAVYKEELKVKNSGTIPVFVRVTVYRYWTEKDVNGKEVKVQVLDPGLIELGWSNYVKEVDGGNDAVWVMDEKNSTPERTVLYYTKILGADLDTEPFTSTFSVSENVKNRDSSTVTVTGNDGGTDYTTTYTYSGKQFHLEAVAEVVQAENGQEAIVSSWGVRNVKVSGDGSLEVLSEDFYVHKDASGNDVSGGDVSGDDNSDGSKIIGSAGSEPLYSFAENAAHGKGTGQAYAGEYAAGQPEEIPDTDVRNGMSG